MPLLRNLFASLRLPKAMSRVTLAVLALAAIVAAPASSGRTAQLLVAEARSSAPLEIAANDDDAVDPVQLVHAALTRCGSRLSDSQRWAIAEAIVSESDRHGYDPLFVQALVEVESTCKPSARSKRGAVGLVQIKPATARAVAAAAGIGWRGDRALSEPALNLRLGLRYLAQLEKRFGDPYLAVAAYNLGPTLVARMSRQRARESRYVRRIMARYESLLSRAAQA